MRTLDLTNDEAELLSGALASAMASLADRIDGSPSFLINRIEQTITDYQSLLLKVESL